MHRPKQCYFLCLILLVCGVAQSVFAQTDKQQVQLPWYGHPLIAPSPLNENVTLHVGDPAPSLDALTWVKGEPVKNLADGKFRVLEFWSIDCHLCKLAMPHLVEIAQQYKDRVDFLAIDGETGDPKVYLPQVKRYVDDHADMSLFAVGSDDRNSTVFYQWLNPVLRGTPTTFVVNPSGKLAYIGDPSFLDKALPLILEGKFDNQAFFTNAYPDWIRTKALFYEYREVRHDGNEPKALELLDQLEKQPYTMTSLVELNRFTLLAQYEPEVARRYENKLLSRLQNNWLVLSYVSRALLGNDQKMWGEIKHPDLGFALKTAKIAADKGAEDPQIQAIYAEALYRCGHAAQAAQIQSQVVSAMSSKPFWNQDTKTEAKKKLALYRLAGKDRSGA